MGEAHREVERKFELGGAGAAPDLTGVGPIARVGDPVTADLAATYFDTPDLRLARSGTTLRRRTGGKDAGWHLKLPRDGDARVELHEPLHDGDEKVVPAALGGMVRGRVGHRRLEPVATIHTVRVERELLDGSGRLLATVADDHVRASRSHGGSVDLLEWREVEAELEAGDDALLDEITKRYEASGVRRSDSPSKLQRVLGDEVRRAGPELHSKVQTAIYDHIAAQVEAIIAGDAHVRSDDAEAVHDMRVGTRRLRSTLATFRPFLDARRTEPLRDELRWLGQELGRLRDTEVLAARLRAIVTEEPPDLVLGPVAQRIDIEMHTRERDARDAVLIALDSNRYLDLVEDLHDLVDEPPWSDERRPTKKRVRRRVEKAFTRMDDRAARVPEEPGEARDAALHELRKAAKRARYAAEAVVPLFGEDAERSAARAEELQDVLGEHQDSVRSQHALRQLGVVAHLSGENGFTFGVLLGAERDRAATADAEHGDALRRAATDKARGWMD